MKHILFVGKNDKLRYKVGDGDSPKFHLSRMFNQYGCKNHTMKRKPMHLMLTVF